ncbi:FAD-dependent monooxygenase [Pseudoalteromonas sp. S1608]|uniref:FAD-dependent monooxygenase n=1 Tax=Pseudoalteromonas sp. S1608 TaxID=579504 RepID=UPI00110AAF22|nr:FAD-dependent monooxygenase [Pseudoalteromonas sp. S1608]TMP75019.1 monooxygenase [Pseudoalteromonas sp. S1608]
MSKVNHIAIIGAGVAGLAFAIFARKQGIKVTIYERNSHFSSIGAGVTLWPNAMFVIKQMGLINKFSQLGGQPSFMRQFSRADTQHAEFDIKALNSTSGFPTITILRRDLISILARELKSLSATIHFNRSINTEDIHQLKKQFDLVIGCDGRMHSAARELLYHNTVLPKYQGFINIIGISKMDLAAFNQSIHDYRNKTERFGIVPVANNFCYWAAAWPSKIDKTKQIDDWYNEMRLRFKNWPEKIQTVFNYSEQNSIKQLFVHDLDPLPYWHNENLLIIGDAAHAPLPTSGQGASQALEDVWHLSQILNKGEQLETVLKRFYETRINKTTTAQQIGRQVAKQIFTQQPSQDSATPEISVTQLSQLYMQGLNEV